MSPNPNWYLFHKDRIIHDQRQSKADSLEKWAKEFAPPLPKDILEWKTRDKGR